MLQPSLTPSFLDSSLNSFFPPMSNTDNEQEFFDLLARLEELESMILDSPRVPLTGKTVIDEDRIMEEIDRIRDAIPLIAHQAREILVNREQIIQGAHHQAMSITNELSIIERAEQEAQKIRQMVRIECDQLKQQTMAEIQRMQQQGLEDLQLMRQEILKDSQDIQTGADQYADQVLGKIETQLNDMLKIVQRGRQELHPPQENS
jgi:hypothetical protein